MRFVRQGYEIEVPVPEFDSTAAWGAAAIERFHADHERLYGFAPDASVEAVNLRVEAVSSWRFEPPEPQPLLAGDGARARLATSKVYAAGEWIEAGVYERRLLRPGDVVAGPAVFVQDDATTFVPPLHEARTLSRGEMMVERGPAQ